MSIRRLGGDPNPVAQYNPPPRQPPGGQIPAAGQQGARAPLTGTEFLAVVTTAADRIKGHGSQVRARFAAMSDTLTWGRHTGSVGSVLAHIFQTLPPGAERSAALSEASRQFVDNLAGAKIGPERARQIFNEVVTSLPSTISSPEAVEDLVSSRVADLVQRELAQQSGSSFATDLLNEYGPAEASRILNSASHIVPGHDAASRLVLSYAQMFVQSGQYSTR